MSILKIGYKIKYFQQISPLVNSVDKRRDPDTRPVVREDNNKSNVREEDTSDYLLKRLDFVTNLKN